VALQAVRGIDLIAAVGCWLRSVICPAIPWNAHQGAHRGDSNQARFLELSLSVIIRMTPAKTIILRRVTQTAHERLLGPMIMKITDYIGVRMPGWLAVEMGMARRELRVLMRNDIGIDHWPDARRNEHSHEGEGGKHQ
jgi:hypothetical protein